MVRAKLLLPIAFVVAILIGSFWYFIHAPLNNSNESVIYTLKSGTPSSQMLNQLKAKKILGHSQAIFLGWLIYFEGSEKKLKAGEYQIQLNTSPKKLIDKFVRGEVIQYSFTIVEGCTFNQIMALINDNPKIVHTLKGKSSQEIMILLGSPFPPEGQFFPETYFYPANTSDISLLKRAYQLMQKNLQGVWDRRSRNIQLTSPYEALILASIIEKEAVVDIERPLISNVLQQRLLKNMFLQADPTVIYGLGEQYTGKLSHEDLKKESPYNTYLHKGLPPTPIGNPGIKAIIAALHPEQSDALYFVAKGDGTHYFSATLAEHNEAVKRYLRKAENVRLYQLGDGL